MSELARKVGRPTIYDPEYHPALVHDYALLGYTEERIAGCLDIAWSTLKDWKEIHEEFSASLKAGKEIANTKVAKSLFANAVGQTVLLNKTSVTKDGDIIHYTEELYIPPQTTAQIFFLKNKEKELWKDRHDITTPPNEPFQTQALPAFDTSKLNPEQLAQLAVIMEAAGVKDE
jgi:hypothetical protein